MLSGYANGGATAGRSYIGTIAALLCQYPRQVALECADPLRGVATVTRFLPTPADVVSWCEPRVEAMAGKIKKAEQVEQQFQDRDKFESERPGCPDPIPAGCLANLFVPASAPKYTAMVQRAEAEEPRNSYREPGREGIWVPISWYTDAAAAPGKWKRFTVSELKEIYARNGAAPQPHEAQG